MQQEQGAHQAAWLGQFSGSFLIPRIEHTARQDAIMTDFSLLFFSLRSLSFNKEWKVWSERGERILLGWPVRDWLGPITFFYQSHDQRDFGQTLFFFFFFSLAQSLAHFLLLKISSLDICHSAIMKSWSFEMMTDSLPSWATASCTTTQQAAVGEKERRERKKPSLERWSKSFFFCSRHRI